jgi:hypothetical protein
MVRACRNPTLTGQDQMRVLDSLDMGIPLLSNEIAMGLRISVLCLLVPSPLGDRAV